MIDRRLFFGFDYFILIAACGIALSGLLAINSITYQSDQTLFAKQALWILAAILAFLLVIAIDYHILGQLAFALYFLSLLPLLYLLIMGRTISGAKSWITLGPVSLQPSEFVKLTTVLVCAYYLSETQEKGLKLSGIMLIGVLTGVPFILIAMQPDLGTALTYLVLFVGMMFFSGANWRFFVVIFLIFLIIIPIAWFFVFKDYQKARVLTFLSPSLDPRGSGYQIIQSKIAVGSGGLLGKGWRMGSQSQLKFVPEQATDFIFSVLAEEWGLMGTVFVLGLYFFVLMRCADIASQARDSLGAYMVMGFTTIFCFQVILNIGMIIGLFPTTGLPLPLMSYGGSSMVVMFMGLGIVINVNMRRFAY